MRSLGASARALLRGGREHLLVATGVAAGLRRRRGGRRLILAYHNILPEGKRPWGERSLHLAVERFRKHLDELEATATLVSVDRLLDPAPLDPRGPAVALTFDDGYAGTVAAVRELLAPRGIPCTIFVNPGHPEGQPFWWDVLGASLSPDGELPEEVRNHCLVELHGDRNRVLEWARTRWTLDDRAPDPAFLAVPPSDLAAGFREDPLVELRSHGWSHRNLAALEPGDLAEELARPREWLEEQGLGSGGGISYPYGLSDGRVEAAAQAAGYAWGLRVSGGFLDAGTSRPRAGARKDPSMASWALPRFNVPAGLSRRGLALRLAGIGI